ncbi:MAG TPA: CBS domain-containing protein [Mariprofundaceae bacterium]|nr:CBS domain-containing protein [Mariprofundaceae bacterium]
MLAERVMKKSPVTVSCEEHVHRALEVMRQHNFRMLPVVDGEGHVRGLFFDVYVIEKLVPEYITDGHLDAVSYAPDIGVLHTHYVSLMNKRVEELMDTDPLLVKPGTSLLSVASALISHDRHECALVVDKENRLLGLITARDVLDWLWQLKDEVGDA